jgi:hypothetical protein
MPGHRVEGSRVLAVKRRLDTDTLTPDDMERLELTRRLRELQREGKTLEECGAILGLHPKTLGHFMRRGVYKLLCDYLERVERGEDAQAVERMMRWARVEFVRLAPYAIEYFESCFERNLAEEWAERGRWKDDAKARWAAQLIAKGIGLLDPQPVARPVIHISTDWMRAELEEVAAEDAKAEAAWRASPEMDVDVEIAQSVR